MLPIKQKELIAKTAEITGLPLETVTIILKEYYKTVRERVSNMAYPAIMLEGIGNFYIKEKMLKYEIEDKEKIIKRMELKEDSVRKEKVIRGCSNDLEQYRNMENMLEERRKKLYEMVGRKIEYKYGKKNNNDLEK